jgi:hypothetical protein
MERMQNSSLQGFYLTQELEQSILVIEHGLAMLQRNRVDRPKHFVFLTLLSSGLERLMKIILCLHTIETEGRFLSESEFKDFRHDLAKLLQSVVDKCFTAKYLKRPVAGKDLYFIKHEEVLKEMLKVLSDFAKRDRYIFMDGISKPAMNHEWPDRRWEEIERKVISPDQYPTTMDEQRIDASQALANRTLVSCLERLLRALARLFTLAEIGQEGRSKLPLLWNFLMLWDEDIGKREYDL